MSTKSLNLAASTVLFHPFLTSTLQISATTVGRDKIYRAIQYLSRFLAWYCLRKGYAKATVEKFDKTKSALGTGRKLMRLGKPLEHLQNFLRSFDQADPILRFTAAGRQIGYALYLINDMFSYLHSQKIYPLLPATASKVSLDGARFWFAGITFSIISGLHKIRKLRNKRRQLKEAGRSDGEKDVARNAELKGIESQLFAVRYQLVQDSLDILLPASTLGYHGLDDGALGIAGFITSIMGIRTQAQKVLGK